MDSCRVPPLSLMKPDDFEALLSRKFVVTLCCKQPHLLDDFFVRGRQVEDIDAGQYGFECLVPLGNRVRTEDDPTIEDKLVGKSSTATKRKSRAVPLGPTVPTATSRALAGSCRCCRIVEPKNAAFAVLKEDAVEHQGRAMRVDQDRLDAFSGKRGRDGL